jgi:hypothetical protein
MRAVTVKKLREMLANVSDDALLVVPGQDHNYRVADVHATTAIRSKYGLEEDFKTNLEEFETRIEVLLVT